MKESIYIGSIAAFVVMVCYLIGLGIGSIIERNPFHLLYIPGLFLWAIGFARFVLWCCDRKKVKDGN